MSLRWGLSSMSRLVRVGDGVDLNQFTGLFCAGRAEGKDVPGAGGRDPRPDVKRDESWEYATLRENVVGWLEGIQSIVESSFPGGRGLSEWPSEVKSN